MKRNDVEQNGIRLIDEIKKKGKELCNLIDGGKPTKNPARLEKQRT